jgi:hypothetical protein
MRNALLAAASALVLASTTLSTGAQAQTNIDQAIYVTCRDAHAMQPEPRKALAVFLAEHSSRHRGVAIPDGEIGQHLALLVRGGCTLAPDAYLFTVIDRAIVAELAKLPKR